MKPSLEEERQALLAQIEASRAVYRRMLSGTQADMTSHTSVAATHGSTTDEPYADFPRSRTVRWMMDHPLAVAACVSLLVWAGPRWWASRGRPASLKTLKRRQAVRNMANEGDGRTLLTAAALLMRNPSTLRTLSSAARMAWQWLQKRRIHRSDIH